MSDRSPLEHELAALIDQEVVIDVKGRHVYVGTLRQVGEQVFVLANADVHFCDDSQTTTELYLVETKKNEVRPNRAAVYVMRTEIVSISRLDDVILY